MNLCKCGRRRYTTQDLLRWRAEFPDGKPHPDPPWAKEICFLNVAADRCPMKPFTPDSPKETLS